MISVKLGKKVSLLSIASPSCLCCLMSQQTESQAPDYSVCHFLKGLHFPPMDLITLVQDFFSSRQEKLACLMQWNETYLNFGFGGHKPDFLALAMQIYLGKKSHRKQQVSLSTQKDVLYFSLVHFWLNLNSLSQTWALVQLDRCRKVFQAEPKEQRTF